MCIIVSSIVMFISPIFRAGGNEKECRRLGERAREVITANQGATARTLDLVGDLVQVVSGPDQIFGGLIQGVPGPDPILEGSYGLVQGPSDVPRVHSLD